MGSTYLFQLYHRQCLEIVVDIDQSNHDSLNLVSPETHYLHKIAFADH